MARKDNLIKFSEFSERKTFREYSRIEVLKRIIEIEKTIALFGKRVSRMDIADCLHYTGLDETKELINAVMRSDRQNWLSSPALYLAQAAVLKERLLESHNNR